MLLSSNRYGVVPYPERTQGPCRTIPTRDGPKLVVEYISCGAQRRARERYSCSIFRLRPVTTFRGGRHSPDAANSIVGMMNLASFGVIMF